MASLRSWLGRRGQATRRQPRHNVRPLQVELLEPRVLLAGAFQITPAALYSEPLPDDSYVRVNELVGIGDGGNITFQNEDKSVWIGTTGNWQQVHDTLGTFRGTDGVAGSIGSSSIWAGNGAVITSYDTDWANYDVLAVSVGGHVAYWKNSATYGKRDLFINDVMVVNHEHLPDALDKGEFLSSTFYDFGWTRGAINRTGQTAVYVEAVRQSPVPAGLPEVYEGFWLVGPSGYEQELIRNSLTLDLWDVLSINDAGDVLAKVSDQKPDGSPISDNIR